jgi:hypothetical protein
VQRNQQHEYEQDQQLSEVQSQQAPPQVSQYQAPAPQAAPPPSRADRVKALTDLKGLLDAGVLTQGEFESREAEDPPGRLTMPFGPMQLLIIGFGDTEPTGEIAAELRRLREHDIVRLVDLLVVMKDADGRGRGGRDQRPSPDEAEQLGAIASALDRPRRGRRRARRPADLSLGQEVWYVADAIPEGTTAAIAVLEHRWAIPLRERSSTAAASRSPTPGCTRPTSSPSASRPRAAGEAARRLDASRAVRALGRGRPRPSGRTRRACGRRRWPAS